MTEQRVSARYARALLDAAKDKPASEEILKDLEFISEVADESRDFRTMIESPVIYNWQKKKVISEIFETKISKITLQFLLLLADKKRESLIFDIIEQYRRIFNKRNNRLPIKVVSAVELSNDLKEKIAGKISLWTEKTVLPTYAVDSSLKGGLKVEIEDWIFDATLKNQLDVLYHTLAKN